MPCVILSDSKACRNYSITSARIQAIEKSDLCTNKALMSDVSLFTLPSSFNFFRCINRDRNTTIDLAGNSFLTLGFFMRRCL